MIIAINQKVSKKAGDKIIRGSDNLVPRQ